MQKNDNPKIVDEYIGSKPPEAQAKLQELRMILLDSLPNVREALRWGEPAILHPDGMILLIFARYKQHMNLVATPSTKQAFTAELKGYKTGKDLYSSPTIKLCQLN